MADRSWQTGRPAAEWARSDSTWRGKTATGGCAVNERLVPALFESPNGGSYSVVDSGVSPGQSLTYRLVEVETIGRPDRSTVPMRSSPMPRCPTAPAASTHRPGQRHRPCSEDGHELRRSTRGDRGSHRSRRRIATQMKIEVIETGLYRVDASDLVDALQVSRDPRSRSHPHPGGQADQPRQDRGLHAGLGQLLALLLRRGASTASTRRRTSTGCRSPRARP